MRKLYLLSSLTLLSFSTFSQTFEDKYLRDGFYHFDDILKLKQNEALIIYKPQFGFGVHDSFGIKNHYVDSSNHFFTKYQLYHKGVPVLGSFFNLMGRHQVVQYITGDPVRGLVVDINNTISKEEAISNAKAYLGASSYAWESDEAEASIREIREDSSATYYPKPKLVILKSLTGITENFPSNFQLCYEVDLVALDPQVQKTIYVNANTGAIFTVGQQSFEAYTTIGSVQTQFDGYQSNSLRTASCAFCSN